MMVFHPNECVFGPLSCVVAAGGMRFGASVYGHRESFSCVDVSMIVDIIFAEMTWSVAALEFCR